MWNWDTWSPVEFSRRNVYTVDHELYPDLVDVFADAGQPMQQPSEPQIKRTVRFPPGGSFDAIHS
jgi:hypothetical protein